MTLPSLKRSTGTGYLVAGINQCFSYIRLLHPSPSARHILRDYDFAIVCSIELIDRVENTTMVHSAD